MPAPLKSRSLIFLLLLLPASCDNSPPPAAEPPTRASATASAPATPRFDIGVNAEALALRPLSEFEGVIRRVVIHVPQRFVDRLWTPIHALLGAVPARVHMILACDGHEAAEELRGRIAKAGFQMRVNTHVRDIPRPMLIWSRDRYIVTRPAPPGLSVMRVCLVPQLIQHFDAERRAGEREIPRLLNEPSRLFDIAETPLVLEGGNVLAAGKHVLIGANVVTENADRFNRDEVLARLSRLFKPRVLLVNDSTGQPPVGHIDMFVTVVGENHILVGSPKLAADIMVSADDASRKALDERLFITSDMPEPKGPDFSAARIGRFDQVAAALEGAGHKVTRIPYVDSRNGDFSVTYNNVLQESNARRHVVYMPIYQIPALDQAAQRAYESFGMTVEPIDVSTVCHLLGAVRCMANVIERETEPRP